MLGLAIGIPAGMLLVFTHRMTRTKSLGSKLAIGLLAGLGVGVLINAILDAAGLTR